MDIKSLNSQIKVKSNSNKSSQVDGVVLADLFTSCFVYDPTIPLSEYTVQREEEMRLDLIMGNMYDVEGLELFDYLAEMDIILFINGIDNPLNIREGLVLRYPEFADFDKFRINDVDRDFNKTNNISKRLSFPNKKTRKDKSRQDFIKNGYSLPPVVLETPKDPVRIEDGKFSIGGL